MMGISSREEKRVLLHHYCGLLHEMTDSMPVLISDGHEIIWYQYADRIKELCDELCGRPGPDYNAGLNITEGHNNTILGKSPRG